MARVLHQPALEGFAAHRADHQDQIFLLVRRDRENHFAADGVRDVADGGEHAAGVGRVVRRGKEKLRHLEDGDEAGADAVGPEHGEHADVALLHHAEDFGHGGGGRNAHHVAGHHVADLRRDIRHETRRGHAEGLEHEVDAVVGVAAARGHGVGQAGAALEFRVADGRADGVGVGIAMADDEDFTHAVFKISDQSGDSGSNGLPVHRKATALT